MLLKAVSFSPGEPIRRLHAIALQIFVKTVKSKPALFPYEAEKLSFFRIGYHGMMTYSRSRASYRCFRLRAGGTGISYRFAFFVWPKITVVVPPVPLQARFRTQGKARQKLALTLARSAVFPF
eukprot:759307-Hanusia_phi.AAC.2